MDKEKQDKFNEKVSKYVAEGFFSEQEVNQKIGEIERRIRCLGSESPKNKKNIEKELNSGEKVVKEIDEGDSNKKYVIRFFYNKKDNKLVLKNIFEYQRDDKTAYIVTDVIITLYTIIFTY